MRTKVQRTNAKPIQMNCEKCRNYHTSGNMGGVTLPGKCLSFEAAEFARWVEHAKTHRERKGNGKPQGAFAFTLTMSPADNLTAADLVLAVRKIMSQKSMPVKRYAWAYEDKGDGKHPHIHGMYETETGQRIHTKFWKRAWKIWDETKPMGQGHRGGYHRPVLDEDSYKDYIGKDGGLSENKNLPQEYNNARPLPDRTRIYARTSTCQDSGQEGGEPSWEEVLELCEESAGSGKQERGNQICQSADTATGADGTGVSNSCGVIQLPSIGNAGRG